MAGEFEGIPAGEGNILFNGDFKNAINQRGQSSYTGAGYGIDGWFSQTWNPITVTLTASGLAITGAEGVRQWIDDIQYFKGKKVTASAKVDGKLIGFVADVPAGVFSTGQTQLGWVSSGNASLSLYAYNTGDSEYLYIVIGGSVAGGTVTFEYVKLEEGKIATPLVREDPTVKLLRCQRTLLRPGVWPTMPIRMGYFYDDLRFVLPIPTKMRVVPSIVNQSSFGVTSLPDRVDRTGYTFNIVNMSSCFLTISAYKEGSNLTDAALGISENALISAEI
jgi:hypothetical protein